MINCENSLRHIVILKRLRLSLFSQIRRATMHADENDFDGASPLAWAWQYLISAEFRPQNVGKLQWRKFGRGIRIIRADSPPDPLHPGHAHVSSAPIDDLTGSGATSRLRNSISGRRGDGAVRATVADSDPPRRQNTKFGSRVVSVLDSGAEGPGLKSQPRRCRVTVLGKLFTPIVPLFTKQQNC